MAVFTNTLGVLIAAHIMYFVVGVSGRLICYEHAQNCHEIAKLRAASCGSKEYQEVASLRAGGAEEAGSTLWSERLPRSSSGAA
jgi:hypothetical protein